MKHIKGFVTYNYKGVQYFEQPRNTYISKIEYDEVENMSTVYLKRSRMVIELLCIILLCFTVYFVYAENSCTQTIHMPSSYYYYDGRLYLNVVADKGNSNTVSYNIAGYSGVLNPGESLEYIDYTYNNQTSETITYTVNTLWFSRKFSKDIPVGVLSFNDGGLEYEGY